MDISLTSARASDGDADRAHPEDAAPAPAAAAPPTDGEMAQRIRAFDWSRTPLGPASSWSPALRTTLDLVLASRFPHLLWWGPDYIQLYNDAYRPIPGVKHPDRALGVPARECWAEIWPVIGPLIDRPFFGGPATWDDDIFLEVRRHGFVEESHFVIAYSPVPDDSVESGIGGVLATVHEITEKIVGERRVRALRDLGARVGEAKTAEEACSIAAATLAGHSRDVPFALVYLLDGPGRRARLAGSAGVDPGSEVAPPEMSLDGAGSAWPVAEAVRTERMQIVERLGDRFAPPPRGPWSDPPHTAVVVPVPSNRPHDLAAVLVLGVSARLRLDAAYLDFFHLLQTQIAATIANARAYEEERRRAEALAEIDRAKTAFFSNVSHEFRTPLTLLLGPIEDMLGAEPPELAVPVRDRLRLAHRNGLRLLKLVNTLLDFSRIEAGRVRATYRPTDLSGFTADLASVFRSAFDRAGLRLTVDAAPLSAPVYVDREMWEKIVLNLLSNAFKYTFSGGVTVTLRDDAGAIELRVEDTGIGVPADEIPRLFERFHRVTAARGRTHEGSGIGLALVQELVRLHGGEIRAESAEGRGTTFIVTLPGGRAHLPAEQVVEGGLATRSAQGAEAFVEEALRWLPDDAAGEGLGAPNGVAAGLSPEPPPAEAAAEAPLVLVADDNLDMRQYVGRLLSGRYRIAAAADGESALASARRETPDLILTDVMMPRLDGFGLLNAVREDPALRDTPVILLSARAGEESRVEGLGAGADDYLVKPFSARELTARVETHLKMARLRREANASREHLLLAERQARQDAERANRLKDDFVATVSHELRTPLNAILGWSQLLMMGGRDTATIRQGVDAIHRSALSQAQLIEDLLDMSRIVQGQLRLDLSRVNPADAVDAAIESVTPSARLKGIVLDRTLDRGVGPVLADASRLHQVVANLLTNAVKFTPENGRVEVFLRRAAEGIEITVSDSGVGIEAEFLPSVFDRFRQEDASSSRRHGGLGLGLALVKQLTEMQGGTVSAHSDGRGRGATFRVVLPFAPEVLPGDPRGPAADGPAPSLSGIEVLFVDDDPDARMLGERILADCAARVTLAGSAEEALRILTARRPDVLVSDIAMPDADGYELIERVRRLPPEEGGDTPAAALTAFARAEDRERALRAGYHAHLSKPVVPENLVAVVARLAARRKTRG